MQIAVLTAKDFEWAAVESLLRQNGAVTRDRYSNIVGKIRGYSRSHHVVILPPPGYGVHRTANRAKETIDKYPDVKYLVFVGCSGGVRGARTGDLVISENVIDLSHVRLNPDHTVTQRGQLLPASGILLSYANTAQASLRFKPVWKEYIKPLIKDRDDKELSKEWNDILQEHTPDIQIGNIGSGMINMNDPEVRDNWAKSTYQIIAFEMEGIAVGITANMCDKEFILIRGISDLSSGNRRRDKVLQPYAARVATAFLGALFKLIPPEFEKNIPTRPDVEYVNIRLQRELQSVFDVTLKDRFYDELAGFEMAKYLCVCDVLMPSLKGRRKDIGRALSLLVRHCLESYLKEIGWANVIETSDFTKDFELLCTNCRNRNVCYGISVYYPTKNAEQRQIDVDSSAVRAESLVKEAKKGLLSIYLKYFKRVHDRQDVNLRDMKEDSLDGARKRASQMLLDTICKLERCFVQSFEIGLAPINVAKPTDEDYQGIFTLDRVTYRDNPARACWQFKELYNDVRTYFPEGVRVAKNRAGAVLGYTIVLPMKQGFVDDYRSQPPKRMWSDDWYVKKDCYRSEEARHQNLVCFQVDNICIFPHEQLRNRLLGKLIAEVKTLLKSPEFPGCDSICAVLVTAEGQKLAKVYCKKLKQIAKVDNYDAGTFMQWKIPKDVGRESVQQNEKHGD